MLNGLLSQVHVQRVRRVHRRQAEHDGPLHPGAQNLPLHLVPLHLHRRECCGKLHRAPKLQPTEHAGAHTLFYNGCSHFLNCSLYPILKSASVALAFNSRQPWHPIR